jgi:hypothetical protein
MVARLLAPISRRLYSCHVEHRPCTGRNGESRPSTPQACGNLGGRSGQERATSTASLQGEQYHRLGPLTATEFIDGPTLATAADYRR